MVILTLAYLYLADGLLNIRHPLINRSVTLNQLRRQRIVVTLQMSLFLAGVATLRLLT